MALKHTTTPPYTVKTCDMYVDKPTCIVYAICTSCDIFSYHQIIIYMQSIYPYRVHTRISIANVHFLPLESPQLLLRCNYDAPGPRGHLVASHCPVFGQSLNRIKKYEKMWKPSHNQEPFASRMWHRWVDFWFKTVPYTHKFGWNLQLEWFNNPQVPGRLTMEWDCTPVKNKVKTTIRLVKSKLHPRVHHALLINLWRTRKPITR